MDLTLDPRRGVASGTVLLFAAVGEIFAERSGVLNLGVEGMMLMGAVAGFSTTVATGNPWLGLVVAMLAGGLLSLLHGVVTIHLRADQVVSGLALTFLGTGLARVLGDGLSNAGAIATLPRFSVPVLSTGPAHRTDLLPRPERADVRRLPARAAGLVLDQPDPPGLHLRAVGERPSAADAQGIDVYRTRYAYVFVGGLLAGPGRRARSRSPSRPAGSATRPSAAAAGSPSAS